MHGAGRSAPVFGLNFPSIAQGDYFQAQVNYTQGALRYLFFTPNSDWVKVNGNRKPMAS